MTKIISVLNQKGGSGMTTISSNLAHVIAQEVAQNKDLGIWNGNPQEPWEWRKAN